MKHWFGCCKNFEIKEQIIQFAFNHRVIDRGANRKPGLFIHDQISVALQLRCKVYEIPRILSHCSLKHHHISITLQTCQPKLTWTYIKRIQVFTMLFISSNLIYM